MNHQNPAPPTIPEDQEGLFGHPRVNQPMTPDSLGQFNGVQLPMAALTALQDPSLSRDFKDELVKAIDRSITPGVPDGPYIQYALEALTRAREDGQRGYPKHDSSESNKSYPRIHHLVPNATPGLFQSRPQRQPQPEPSRLLPESSRISEPSPVQLRKKRVQSPAGPTVPQSYTHELPQDRHPEWHRAHPSSPRDTPFRELPPIEFPGAESRITPMLIPEQHLGYADNEVDDSRAQHTRTPQSAISSILNLPRNVERWQAEPTVAHAADLEKVGSSPPLSFKPWILRDESLLLLMSLCLLMIAALIFCAVYSVGRNGFMPYGNTLYGGDYFLFRILPQLLAAALLVYAQCVITAAFRVLPFSLMASDDVQERRDAVFLPLYPKSFLWPQLVGPWNVWIPVLNVWLLNFTIPLQCSLFAVVLVDGTWTWATVQAVAWTLVALYVSFLSATVIMFIYWRGRRTGMLSNWDLRTLADIIFISAQSNSLRQYHGTETYSCRKNMRFWLRDNVEKLGFWYSAEAPELPRWYSIGVLNGEEKIAFNSVGGEMWDRLREESSARRLRLDTMDARSRYLPWCLRTGQITFFVVSAFVLLVALIVVSFNRATDLRQGFLPGLSAAPTAGVFSAANFLYSFVPSLLGMILFLAFQSLDLTLRILTPWGELAREEGSRAEKSLLLDYAACMPWEATYKAIKQKHWRAAFISFLAPFFILIPVLAGGLFLALTPPSGIVRMYPNIGAFAFVLALLIFYVFGLISLVPKRDQFRLPHAATCLAEIISFCCNEELRTDPAFNYPRSPEELRARLDVSEDWHRQGRWAFGYGRSDNERLGIKRHSKYTVSPRNVLQYDKQARGEVSQAHLPNSSRSLFREDNPQPF
ncbi:hypothetical protein DL762_003190 [Monosporascus cannonballus]|uniref:Phosphoribosylaminoimidazole-succinocarboxamide synthase n=1 Tax=Monosporascus cannonballus TaxID=155416 RepID=A0ABY0HBS9_9PEZI|nr:hypothetical protein DL762_003190 [Monosporascus cannonballus]